MKDWFYGLEEREQRFVAAAAVVVVIAIFYIGIWLPLDNAQKETAASVDLWRTSVEQIGALKGRVGNTSNRRISQNNLNQPLVVVVDSTLRNRQMASPQRSQPAGNNIRVEFEDASFDELVLWLGDLSNQYALSVQSGSFTASGNSAPGRVNANLTLGR